MPRSQGRSPALLLNLLISLRPGQWTKNLFVFAALVFAQRLDDPDAVLRAVVAFVVFCALSGAIYLINDVLDREQDRRHPLKSQPADRVGRAQSRRSRSASRPSSARPRSIVALRCSAARSFAIAAAYSCCSLPTPRSSSTSSSSTC